MLVSVFFFLIISLIIVLGFAGPVARELRVAGDILTSKQTYFLAESAAEDAYYRITHNKQIGTSTTLSLNGGTATTTITTPFFNQRSITSLGDVSGGQRKVTLLAAAGDGVTFQFGTQAGQGGIIFENNAYLLGNLYSNGNVTGANGSYITGTTFAAGGLITGMSCLGGVASGSSCSGTPTGHAYAHTITNSKVTGTLYCQTGSGNNAACNTSQPDPVTQPMPISDATITDWKSDAAAGTIVNGDVTISSNTTLGPTKIIGNLTITGSSILTIANTIWVTGNILFNGSSGSKVKLASSYAAQSGIIIADGYINIGNNTTFEDSGTAGSYILVLSTSTCDEATVAAPCSANNAIAVRNNASIVIANAQNGTVSFANNATLKEAAAKTIRLKQNVGISYGSGLINVGFTSGPSGSWGFSNWKEAQ